MMKYYVADAFTDRIFEGNLAGVCEMSDWPSEEKMSRIAIENNLSETAFAVCEDEDTYGIRWFTPGGRTICADMPRWQLLMRICNFF